MSYREKPSTFDRLLAKNPPRITWRKNHRGVLVAVAVRDPHADTGYRRKETA